MRNTAGKGEIYRGLDRSSALQEPYAPAAFTPSEILRIISVRD